MQIDKINSHMTVICLVIGRFGPYEINIGDLRIPLIFPQNNMTKLEVKIHLKQVKYYKNEDPMSTVVFLV